MRNALFHVDKGETFTLQAQIREGLVSAVLAGQLSAMESVPSTRAMARQLGVSRNTVVLSYQALVEDGFLLARERSGFYVNPEVLTGLVPSADAAAPTEDKGEIDWQARLRIHPAGQVNIVKPEDWRDHPYLFIYGQIDHTLFPISEWRDCVRQAMGAKGLDQWTADRFNADDPMLIEQIRTRILPRRGIAARDEEILITMGAQNALYLVSSLLVGANTRVAIEDPGYPDARNMFALRTRHVVPIPVDENGLLMDERLAACQLAFITPSHHFPTTATLPLSRRKELLALASANDLIILEDDYEFEANYVSAPTPALKSLDKEGRVIYIGSLSKSLVPGVRIGFLVAPKPLIDQARALRRLMLRHPPGNNQRAAALFLALGHHDALLGRLHRVYRERWRIMGEALQTHLPFWSRSPTFGGTSYWLEGPPGFDAGELARRALKQGIVIEAGDFFFAGRNPPLNYFRLGFSAIATDRIAEGVRKLAEIVRSLPSSSTQAAE
ncbi:MocR-like pyridoxine biosynthesis transcription factor PdxR [Aurantimonas sp. A3-2-R12]|uniref:MocR-like pyridoxine biosynthesis transcription factor PdxR n=1 Tax=Aurantimonas sp. A3-2-R12 TaxID=3114362 RepID=UPI002E17C957|nr:PLP-dependent aminotransferase family protein [Aurantimonas sp. A3-2-R12]